MRILASGETGIIADMARPSHQSYRTVGSPYAIWVTHVPSWSYRWAAGSLSRGPARSRSVASMKPGEPPRRWPLAAGAPAQDLTPWRPATAHGIWLHDLTVLLDNRNDNGQPGYLGGDTAAAERRRRQHRRPGAARMAAAAHAAQAKPCRACPAPAGGQTVSGELLDRVPRLFELWSCRLPALAPLPAQLPDAAGPVPRVQNLDLAAYGKATGLTLLPGVLAQFGMRHDRRHAANAASPVRQEWPEPSLISTKTWAMRCSGSALRPSPPLRGLLLRGAPCAETINVPDARKETLRSVPALLCPKRLPDHDRGRHLVLILAICLAPAGVRLAGLLRARIGGPQDGQQLWHSVEPQRPMPDAAALPLTTLDGKPFDLRSLHGKWLLAQRRRRRLPRVAAPTQAVHHAQYARQPGQERERLARVWFITDNAPVPDQIAQRLRQARTCCAPIRNNWPLILPPEPAPRGAGGPERAHLDHRSPGQPDAGVSRQRRPHSVRDDIRKLIRNSRIG